MRTLLIMFSAVFITATAQTLALESDVFSINQFAISHSSPVSFSIGYPKGWRVTQDSSPQLGGFITTDGIWICTFWPTNYSSTNWTTFTIWRSGGATTKEAAESFLASTRKDGIYTEKGLSSVRTSAGDSGCLVECEANINGVRVIAHDFFFHSGNKGAIRILIVTPAADSSWRSELDQMVSQTLRFDGA